MVNLIGGTNGKLKAGDCVGVLYIETDTSRVDDRFCKFYKGKWYCVHNGRLAEDYKKGDKQIAINHKTFYDKNNKMIVEELRFLTNLVTVGKITGKSPCKSAIKDQPNEATKTLRPNWCGGIAYRVNSEIRVSNGKYMFYKTSKGQRKCLLESKVLPPKFTVYYRHYNIHPGENGKPPFIKEELAHRTNIVAVASTSKIF